MPTTAQLIQDGQSLASAHYANSKYAIQTYDDGFGPLWISRNSIGINGIVRARTWEDAYSICEDEFFPEADETMEEIIKEYGFKERHAKIVQHPVTGEREAIYPDDYPNGKLDPNLLFVRWDTITTPDPDAWSENAGFCEAFGFRPNGGIYQKDLNGDMLDRLTPEMLAEIGIELLITEEEDN